MITNIVVYLVSFIVIWAGSGLIVSSVSKISKKLEISSFLISFVILGILTSVPEIAVGFTALASNTPGIFVGNLLGGIPVIFFFVIPLLAIAGKGIYLGKKLSQLNILYALLVAILPFFIVLDQRVNNLEGVFLVVSYLVAIYVLQKEHKLITGKNAKIFMLQKYSFLDISKVLFGIVLVLFSSNIIVEKTLYFSHEFQIAPFYISLLVLSLGTNLPELTIALRSVVAGKKDIAFGDYLGSAAANTFLFGLFTLLTEDSVLSVDNFVAMFLVVVIGLVAFFHFTRSRRTISPKEGLILLFVYILFVVFEIVTQAS